MKNLFCICFFLFVISIVKAQILAFPGAEGSGMYTTGGRGGKVYYVNTLEDNLQGDDGIQEGSLRWALSKDEPKTILFKVGGIIVLNSELIINSNTTIAGQSALGDGICIARYPVKVRGDNVIVRFMRFRLGDEAGVEDDAFGGVRNNNVIIDHCSMSWSTDECASFYDNENFTMQWCILSESLAASVHRKGSHGYAAIWGGRKATYHHNLLAHHDSRNPRFCGARYSDKADEELVDFRNNVIYNWGANSGYAGEGGRYNFISNYYKAGKESSFKNRIFSPNADIGNNKQREGVWGKFYLSGNYFPYDAMTSNDNSLGFQPNPDSKDKTELLVTDPFDVALVNTDDAQKAYQKVLKYAGASYIRDKTDKRIIKEVKKGLTPIRASANAGTRAGMIDSQKDVGGWDTYRYNSKTIPADSDIDGIPDGWLKKYYPNKKATDTNEEGYTYLEVYLNSIVKHIIK